MRSAWSIVVMALAVQGCVWAGEYKELEAKHGHLLDVKETWDSEQSELSRRVEDTRLAYQRMTVDQGVLKSQMDSILQALRASKSDLQTISNKVEGQGNLIKEQQHQFGLVTDHFSQVISQVATLAETNHMLANRVEQLTKVTKQTATKVADVNKKISSGGVKRASATSDGAEPTDDAGPKEKAAVLSGVEKMPATISPPSPVADGYESISSPGVSSGPQTSSLSPTSTGTTDLATGGTLSVATGSAPIVQSSVVSTPSSGAGLKPELAMKSGRWQQVKDLLRIGGSTPAKGSEMSASPVVSKSPAASGASHVGEAMAASPRPQSLSTISSTPGVPAPGAVIPSPLITQPSTQP